MIKVLCHGKFDVLHAGHIIHLRAAKKYGDYLTVSITSSEWLKNKPVFTDQERLELLFELKLVDEVYICNGPDGVLAIQDTKPHFYVKGIEYKKIYSQVGTVACSQLRREEKAIHELNGILVYTEGDIFSSSAIRRSHRKI